MEKLFEWTDEFAICPKIDVQHKKMIDIINLLYDGFVKAKANEVLGQVLDELLDYSHYHFRTEEELFEKYNYSKTEEHKREHSEFIEKITQFIEEYKEGEALLSFNVMNFIKDWLLTHILDSDKQYVKEVCKDEI